MCEHNEKIPAKKAEKTTLYCSFCGKSQHEICKLIAGPCVFICDECVASDMKEISETGCDFCKHPKGKIRGKAGKLAICEDCHTLCKDIMHNEFEK